MLQVETGIWAKRKMPAGKSCADVALDAAGPGGRADQAEGHGRSPRDTAPVSSNRACTDAESQSRFDGVWPRRGARRRGVRGTAPFRASSRSKPTPPGRTMPAAEAAAAQQGGQVEEVAADAAAVGGGRQEADVAGQGPQVAGVVGQPLQFQGDAAQRLAAERNLAARPAPRPPGSRPSRGRWWCRRPPSP